MPRIEYEDGAIQVDASIIAEALGIEPSLTHPLMRDGKITSRCERGSDKDAGRYRLTFFFENQRLTLIIDQTGKIVQRSLIDFGDRLAPTALRRHRTRTSGSGGEE